MRKWIAMMLILMLLLGLTSCAVDRKDTDDDRDKSSSRRDDDDDDREEREEEDDEDRDAEEAEDERNKDRDGKGFFHRTDDAPAAEAPAEESAEEPAVEEEPDREPSFLRPSSGSSEVFAQLPDLFVFSSGAGGWSTTLQIAEDGTFTGSFADGDLGDTGEGYPNGTIYICNFSGTFTEPVQVSDTIYSMQMSSLTMESEPGTTYLENDLRYICAGAYGLDDAEELLLYLPGCSLSELAEPVLSWGWLYDLESAGAMPDDLYALYNVTGQTVFFGRKEVS